MFEKLVSWFKSLFAKFTKKPEPVVAPVTQIPAVVLPSVTTQPVSSEAFPGQSLAEKLGYWDPNRKVNETRTPDPAGTSPYFEFRSDSVGEVRSFPFTAVREKTNITIDIIPGGVGVFGGISATLDGVSLPTHATGLAVWVDTVVGKTYDLRVKLISGGAVAVLAG